MKRRMVSISKSTLLSVCLLAHFLDLSDSEDLHEIKIKPGDDVTLQCRGSRDADTVMLKWIRPDLKSEGFVFFLREKCVYENYQHESYHGRVELKDPEMKNGDFSVILKNVNINDAGTYECYTGKKNTAGSELINTINLKVEDQQEIKTKPGDDVTLQCRGSRDADTVTLKWIRPDLKAEGFVLYLREKRVYENYQHPSFHGRVELKDPEMKDGNFSVILKNVNINDAGTYECYVGYGGKPELIKSINLTVVEPGDAAGRTEDEGSKDGWDEEEDGGNTALIIVVIVVLLLLVVGIVGFRIHKKCGRSVV